MNHAVAFLWSIQNNMGYIILDSYFETLITHRLSPGLSKK